MEIEQIRNLLDWLAQLSDEELDELVKSDVDIFVGISKLISKRDS